jgi:low affinity Fe/Cu permease
MKRIFADIATATSRQSGRPITFLLAALTIVVWAISGPLFHYSDTWQLVINTGTTIVTFLMVFVIQNTQNRDGAAIQAKLDELIRVSEGKNTLIGIEAMTEDEIADVRATCALPEKKKVANGARSSADKKAKAAVNKAMS